MSVPETLHYRESGVKLGTMVCGPNVIIPGLER